MIQKSTPFFTIRELMRSFFQQVDKSPQITTSKSRRNASNGSGYKSLADLRPAIGGSEETGLPKEIPIFSVQAPSRRSIFEVQDVENGTEIGEQRPEPTDIPWWAEAIGISPDGDSERETGSPTSSATSKSDTNERDAVSDTSSRSSSNRVQSPKDDGSPIALAPDGSKDKIENLIPRRVTLPVLGGRSRAKSADAGKPKNLAVPEKEIHLQTLSSRKRKEDSSAPKILASLSKSRSKISLGRHPSVGDSQCSADDISDHDPAKLAQSMKRAVLKLKGSWHLLPTLNELMGVCFPQNRMTVHLDSDSARRTAVSALVKWINTASSDMKIPIALCVDDAHWQDTQSWEVLAELLRNCPKVCVFIGSRHIKEYDASMAPYFQSILDSPLVRTATLTSLDENSLGELVVSVFQFRGVQRADPRLLSEILRRTAGNCFVAETVCESMLSYFEEEGELNDPGGRSLMVDDKGTLIHTQVGTSPSSRLAASPSTASPQSPLAQFVERFLPRGAFSAIVTQYDRLGSRFQRILAVASCICQTTIRSLWAVCMRDEELSLLVGGSASPQMLSVFLRAEDKYNFLAFGRPPASPDDVVIGQRNTLAFRHSIIQKAIYSTLLSEEKDRFHSTMVDHLTEDLLDDTNTGQIMPLIIYHLEQLSSGENFRKVDSYITILTYYHEAGFVAEGLSTYAKLNSLLEKTGIQPPPASLFRRSRGYSLMRRETQNEENLGQLIVAQLRRRSSNQVRYLYQQKRTTIEKNVADFYVALHEFEEVTNHIRNSLQYFNKPFPNGATWLRPFLRFRDRVWHMYTFLRLKRSASEGVPLRDIRAQYLIKGMEETAIIWWLDSLCLLESSMSVTSDCSELMHLRLLIFNVSACIASSQPLKFAVGLAVVSTSLAQMGKLIQSEEYLRLAFKIGNINVVQGAKSDITEKPRTEMTRQSLTTRNDGSLLKTVASLRRRISNGSAVSDGENMSEKTRSRNIPLKVNTRQSQLFGRRLSPPFRSGDLGSPQRGSQKWHHGSGFLADPQTPGTAVNSSPEHVLRIATWRSTCLGKWKEAVHYGNLVLSSYEMHSGEDEDEKTVCLEAHRRLASLMTSLPQECKRCETFLRVAALRYTLSSDSDSEKLITSSNLLHCLELDMFAWWTTLTMAVRTLRNWADRLLLRTLSRPMEHENISIEKERWFDVQQLVLRQVNAISYRSHQLELTSMCRVLSRALGSDEALLRRSEHDGKEHHLKHVGQKIQATIDRETPFLENSPMMEAVIMSQLYRTMILESLEGPASTISWTDVRLKDRVVECNTRVHNLLRYQGLSYELRLHQDWAGLLQNA
ncbi:hypothetical protein BJ742DRAFT_867568 [Cladochytrium replicatum]|nr:hypothetical protein BJ742DRAFT_867568 [Cladochytrium replicatum]